MKWILLLLTFSAQAEYRVYQYFVRPARVIVQDKAEYVITSSLDPISYVAYHGGDDVVSVELARTWICPGHTGNFKPYCKSPYQKLLEPRISE
jgi:hypothetical protein